ncbi:MAG: HAMP domain-containing protein, partial [Chloroflexia bacterium]|nr:HAMP domain-containing protein [Chloroflexia bacterium]
MAGLARRRPFPLNRLHRLNRTVPSTGVVTPRDAEGRVQVDAALAAPFYRSIRFRLTAWYALILLVVLLSFGLVLRALVIRELQSNVDSRLLQASTEIAGQTGVFEAQRGMEKDKDGNPDIEKFFLINPPPVDLILLSGLWMGVFDTEGNPIRVGSAVALTALPDDLQRAFENGQILEVDKARYRTVSIDDTKSRVLVHPLQYPGANGVIEVVGAVLVGEPLGNGDRIVSLIDDVLQIASVAGIALAGFGGWILAGRALAPVERITRSADGIANSEGVVSLSRRLDVPHTGDELSRLSLTFNAMLDRIETAFIAQRRFVSDASHELRTPLTSVRGNVDVLLRQHKSGRTADPADVIDALGDVQRESARMGRLIDDL